MIAIFKAPKNTITARLEMQSSPSCGNDSYTIHHFYILHETIHFIIIFCIFPQLSELFLTSEANPFLMHPQFFYHPSYAAPQTDLLPHH